jgi:hypothetical protein
MAIENNIEMYSEAYLRKYAAGELSNAEMHQLEAMALDDPFLADALDGYIAAATLINTTVNNNQRNNLFTRAKLNNVFKIKSWKSITAAAGILFAVGIGSYIVFSGKTKDNAPEIAANTDNSNKVIADSSFTNQLKDEAAKDIIAKEDVQKALEKPLIRPGDIRLVSPPQTAIVPQGDNNLHYNVTPDKDNTADIQAPSLKTEPITTDANASAPAAPSQVAKPNADAAIERKVLEEPRQDSSIAQPDSRINAEQTRYRNVLSTNQAAGNLVKRYGDKYTSNSRIQQSNVKLNSFGFNATIVNQANEQLSFANINLIEKGLLTYASNKGFFNYNSLDSVITLDVTANGYKSKKVTLLPNDKNNTIVLEPLDDNANNGEAFKKQAEREEDVKSNTVNVSKARLSEKMSQIYILPSSNITNDIYPKDSWSLYETYLNNNTIYNRVSNNIKTPGLLILSFTIDKDGYPTNIVVTKSLEKLQDEDAIRLLRSGPKWNVTGSNRSRQLSIVFK